MEVPLEQLLEGLAFVQHVEGEDAVDAASGTGAGANGMAAAAGHLVEAFKEVAALNAVLAVADVPRVPKGSAAFRVRFHPAVHALAPSPPRGALRQAQVTAVDSEPAHSKTLEEGLVAHAHSGGVVLRAAAGALRSAAADVAAAAALSQSWARSVRPISDAALLLSGADMRDLLTLMALEEGAQSGVAGDAAAALALPWRADAGVAAGKATPAQAAAGAARHAARAAEAAAAGVAGDPFLPTADGAPLLRFGTADGEAQRSRARYQLLPVYGSVEGDSSAGVEGPLPGGSGLFGLPALPPVAPSGARAAGHTGGALTPTLVRAALDAVSPLLASSASLRDAVPLRVAVQRGVARATFSLAAEYAAALDAPAATAADGAPLHPLLRCTVWQLQGGEEARAVRGGDAWCDGELPPPPLTAAHVARAAAIHAAVAVAEAPLPPLLQAVLGAALEQEEAPCPHRRVASVLHCAKRDALPATVLQLRLYVAPTPQQATGDGEAAAVLRALLAHVDGQGDWAAALAAAVAV